MFEISKLFADHRATYAARNTGTAFLVTDFDLARIRDHGGDARGRRRLANKLRDCVELVGFHHAAARRAMARRVGERRMQVRAKASLTRHSGVKQS